MEMEKTTPIIENDAVACFSANEKNPNVIEISSFKFFKELIYAIMHANRKISFNNR